MPTDWSDQIIVCELGDEPALSEELGAAYDRLGSGPGQVKKHVVLNFSGVSYVSSSHLAQTLRLRKKCADISRMLILCSLNDQVWSVFTLTGLDRVFRVTQDPLTALATLQLESDQSMTE